ncbi:hypothetical protein [Paenibacillus sp. N3.4]|uniref:hypothetical protein n=1 Tax=Paenibacillus sp. N3.4 TaxID=2603222 RepID=UPI0011C85A7A|nr:hypothetical protein [Paenibacillus sp. N3.4]TXK76389.1 hypothetical protein FU659_25595 [Paenibacillus sp. N3.4]
MRHIYRVTEAIHSKGISYAIGGSGLLLSLGLISAMNDWDVMTEAPLDALIASLYKERIEVLPSGDEPFNSQYRLLVQTDDKPIEIIGSFQLKTDSGIARLPAISAHIWKGLAIASPEVWAVAYELMMRPHKAELLWTYLKVNGWHPDICTKLLQEPLPSAIRSKLEQFMISNP